MIEAVEAVLDDLLPGLRWDPARGLGLPARVRGRRERGAFEPMGGRGSSAHSSGHLPGAGSGSWSAWKGDPAPNRRGASSARMVWVGPDDALLALRDHVYARYFCRWAPGPSRKKALAPHVSGDASFVARLAQAAGTARYWDHGWQVVSAGDGFAFVSDGRIMLFIDDPAALWPPAARVGDAASVLMPCARENLSPGFFYLVGTRGRFDRSRPYPRFYLNVRPGAAPRLAAALLAEFHRREIPFEAKFANDPAAYCRVDPAVLYVGQDHFAGAWEAIRSLSNRHRGWWRDATPLFALPLGRGIAAAECPREEDGPGRALQSFGHHRCELLACGILVALQAGETSGDAVRSAVAAAFVASGLDLERPYAHYLPPEFWRQASESA